MSLDTILPRLSAHMRLEREKAVSELRETIKGPARPSVEEVRKTSELGRFVFPPSAAPLLRTGNASERGYGSLMFPEQKKGFGEATGARHEPLQHVWCGNVFLCSPSSSFVPCVFSSAVFLRTAAASTFTAAASTFLLPGGQHFELTKKKKCVSAASLLT